MKLSDYAKHAGISYQTAWRMWKRGELNAYQLPTGTIAYPNLLKGVKRVPIEIKSNHWQSILGIKKIERIETEKVPVEDILEVLRKKK